MHKQHGNSSQKRRSCEDEMSDEQELRNPRSPQALTRTMEESSTPVPLEARLLHPNVSISSIVDPEEGFGEDVYLRDHESHPLGAAGDTTRSPTSDPLRSWDETYRFRKRFGGLPAMDTLDMMRESSRLFRRQADLLITLTTAFIVPVSVVVLTHVFLTRPVIRWVEARLAVAVFEESLALALQSSYTNFVYSKLSEFLVTSVICIPLAVTLVALAKGGIIYMVALTYAGLKVSFMDIMQRVVRRVWLPLVITYASSCLVFIAFSLAVVFSLGFFDGLFAAIPSSSTIIFGAITLLVVTFVGIFVFLKIILNLANVICVVEDIYGFAAMERSFSVLQGRVQVAICSYLVSCFCGGFLMVLFDHRVTEFNDYTERSDTGSWEGPLLVLMHSFVYMFDEIMITVLYFTCPTSSSLEEFDRPRVPE